MGFWDKFWRDKHGQDVIWQRPNALLITWIVSTVLSWFFTTGMLGRILGIVGLVSLSVWALFEVLFGVNYFRRVVGVCVLILLVVGRLL